MSGRKLTLPPYAVLGAAGTAVSSTTTYYSSSTNVTNLDNISYIPLVVSGTPTGTFDVQVSHDKSNWQSLTLSAVPTITSGTLTNIPISIEGLPFPWIRLNYTNSSGSGTISATVAGKMI